MKHHIRLAVLVVACLVLPASLQLVASEMIGIYAIVDRVVFEPNEQSPTQIQIWGSFATSRDDAPKRGYMYFRLPSAFLRLEVNDVAKKEWADMKAVAKTGQVIGFGQRFFPFVQREQGDAYFKTLGRVRPASERPASPDPYPVNIGLSKISDPAIAKKLSAK